VTASASNVRRHSVTSQTTIHSQRGKWFNSMASRLSTIQIDAVGCASRVTTGKLLGNVDSPQMIENNRGVGVAFRNHRPAKTARRLYTYVSKIQVFRVKMCEMGRPRTPTHILDARGSFVRHPERKRFRVGEPVPTGEIGDPHPALNHDEQEAWKELLEILPPGVATNSDRWWVERAVCLMVLCRKGKARASEQGLLQSYLSKLGMSPADRSRVTVVSGTEQGESPWDALVRGVTPS
jgi:hypothetical protein